MNAVRIKRVYEPPAADDGWRVLVDRVWPRGMTREAAAIDAWLKELGPSHELRRWFDHRIERWDAFQARYRVELGGAAQVEMLQALAVRLETRPLTLLYSARDEQHNQAVVIGSALAALRP